MTKNEIKAKVLSYTDWEFWAERPFGAFIHSLFVAGNTRQHYENIGIRGVWPASLFQDGAFYKSQKVWDAMEKQLHTYLKNGGSFFDVTASCESFYKIQKPRVIELTKSRAPIQERLRALQEILAQIMAYIWLAHGFEHLYVKKLQQEVPKHVSGNTEKFIGDISFPIKKNAHTRMVEALKRETDVAKVTKEYAWIKCRDGFSKVFTVAEMKREKAKLRHSTPTRYVRPAVPRALLPLVKVAQELVYYRTFRTDVLYEFLYLARPLLQTTARHYGIQFTELGNYRLDDLIAGKPKPYPASVTVASWGEHFAFFTGPVLRHSRAKQTAVKGTVAFMGNVRGHAKIVKVAHEIGKVKTGDILVAPTTFPSFIMGMKKAAAFVTDEGGITSHAAIVAREMHKPCVIGTKLATKIFHDGDRLEVDANTGIVKKI